MLNNYEILIRLGLATLLGGVIGVERESVRRAAGFRTHILVCTGSTLVMLLSNYIFDTYRYYVNIDPARLGAQVISGIGFLGAGTIIKEGSSIKGLTTAAGLWAAACIGLAVGIGFYIGAIATTIIVLVTLKVFTKLEGMVPDRRGLLNIQLVIENVPGQINKITEVLGQQQISIIHIAMELDSQESEKAVLALRLKNVSQAQGPNIVDLLSNVKGIYEISIL